MGKMKKIEGQVPDVGGAQKVRADTKGKKARMGKKHKMMMGHSSKSKGNNKPWLLVKSNMSCSCQQSLSMGETLVATYPNQSSCMAKVSSCTKNCRKARAKKKTHARKMARMTHAKMARMTPKMARMTHAKMARMTHARKKMS